MNNNSVKQKSLTNVRKGLGLICLSIAIIFASSILNVISSSNNLDFTNISKTIIMVSNIISFIGTFICFHSGDKIFRYATRTSFIRLLINVILAILSFCQKSYPKWIESIPYIFSILTTIFMLFALRSVNKQIGKPNTLNNFCLSFTIIGYFSILIFYIVISIKNPDNNYLNAFIGIIELFTYISYLIGIIKTHDLIKKAGY